MKFRAAAQKAGRSGCAVRSEMRDFWPLAAVAELSR